MPIEIRELVIRAHVDPGGEPSAARPKAVSPDLRRAMPPRHSTETSQHHLVLDCVQEVLRILERKGER